jgi:hypothetical protein
LVDDFDSEKVSIGKHDTLISSGGVSHCDHANVSKILDSPLDQRVQLGDVFSFDCDYSCLVGSEETGGLKFGQVKT